MIRILSAGMTQAGTEHRLNEDSFQSLGKIYPDTLDAREEKSGICEDYWQIYSVADGMGGAGIGDISARLVQSFLCELRCSFPELDPASFQFPRYIQSFVDAADSSLRQRLVKHGKQPVGTSLALVMFGGNFCYTMSVGSCRIYLLRQTELFRMSRDHVMDEDLDGRPLLFFGNHPGVRFLKAQNLTRMEMEEGDVILILSDGVTNALTDDDILHVFTRPDQFSEQVRSLFLTARRYDARDNQTVMGLKVQARRYGEIFPPTVGTAVARRNLEASRSAENQGRTSVSREGDTRNYTKDFGDPPVKAREKFRGEAKKSDADAPESVPVAIVGAGGQRRQHPTAAGKQTSRRRDRKNFFTPRRTLLLLMALAVFLLLLLLVKSLGG